MKYQFTWSLIDKCSKCPFRYDDGISKKYPLPLCGASDEIDRYIHDVTKKPTWCPLVDCDESISKMADYVRELEMTISDYDSSELEQELQKIAVVLRWISRGMKFKEAKEEYERQREFEEMLPNE
jgi:hypothetical protein